MAPAKILVVEDEAIVALDIERQLEDLGYSVTGLAASGEEAICQIKETRPDLVLMDIRLRGELDGVQTAEQLSRLFDIPVVYLTAHTDAETLARAKLTSPYGYIIKPFEERLLWTIIEIALYKHLAEREKREYVRRLEHEIAERKQVEEALRQSEALYRVLVDTSPDAIILTDLAGHIRKANPRVAQLLGLDSVEAVLDSDKSAIDWLTNEDREQALADIRKNLSQGKLTGLEYTFINQEGTCVTVEVSTAVIADANGQPESLVGIARDITLRKQAEAQMIEMEREKERANMMTTFVRDMAHDIKTPLTVIKTKIYLLGKVNDLDRHRQILAGIDEQADYLSKVFDDVLTLVQLDSNLPFDSKSINFVQIVHGALESLQSDVTDAGLMIEADLRITPIQVRANHELLHRAVLNIANNAVWYTPRGGLVSVKVWSQDNWAICEIRDTGEGMSQATLDRIFQRFYRGDAARSRPMGRSGLGLPIAKKIVELHGGRIEAESILGQGSTFRILLPLHSPGREALPGV